MKRTRYQGVFSVVRFNWHFFLGAAIAAISLIAVACFLPFGFALLCLLAVFGVIVTVLVSLGATYLAYDASPLYRLDWLAPHLPDVGTVANVHAGFDETSGLLRELYPEIDWVVYDFYDPQKHTEISIRRAREAQPPVAGTISHSTGLFPAVDDSLDVILLTLAAHEIRDHIERASYFREMSRSLKPGGVIIVTEHLRDYPNLLAYNFGAFHFHTEKVWLETFQNAGLRVLARENTAPLITTYILTQDENNS